MKSKRERKQKSTLTSTRPRRSRSSQPPAPQYESVTRAICELTGRILQVTKEHPVARSSFGYCPFNAISETLDLYQYRLHHLLECDQTCPVRDDPAFREGVELEIHLIQAFKAAHARSCDCQKVAVDRMWKEARAK